MGVGSRESRQLGSSEGSAVHVVRSNVGLQKGKDMQLGFRVQGLGVGVQGLGFRVTLMHM